MDLGTIWLASASPRRRLLLERAGIAVEVLPGDLEDSHLDAGARPARRWVAAMANLKARRGMELLRARRERRRGVVLAADTVCCVDNRIVGKPRDAAEAGRVIRALAGRAHDVLTGICLIDHPGGRRRLWTERAEVTLGPLDESAIDAYVAGGAWRGKAGGYNYEERLEAGWPLACTGDPDCVTGLPLGRLRRLLEATA